MSTRHVAVDSGGSDIVSGRSGRNRAEPAWLVGAGSGTPRRAVAAECAGTAGCTEAGGGRQDGEAERAFETAQCARREAVGEALNWHTGRRGRQVEKPGHPSD